MTKNLEKFNLEKRIKANPNFKICPICWYATDGVGVLKSDMKQIARSKEAQDILFENCNECKKNLRKWVVFVCEGTHYKTGEDCHWIYVLEVDKIKDLLPWAKKGEVYNIKACPACSENKKFKF
jgi:hypothetical protein